jgi:hypothetical protein
VQACAFKASLRVREEDCRCRPTHCPRVVAAAYEPHVQYESACYWGLCTSNPLQQHTTSFTHECNCESRNLGQPDLSLLLIR